MALIKCTECGHSISDRAIKCPNCGAPLQASSNVAQKNNMMIGNQQTFNRQGYNQSQQFIPQQNQYNGIPYRQAPIQNRPINNPVQNFGEKPEEEQVNNIAILLDVIAYFLYALSLVDFCLGNFAHVDITGVWWSPILLSSIGGVLQAIAKKS
jgi:hypothetical protein